ncbi:MAG: hypothetical protein U5M50_10585 [Sphingobium sp.]|nr:hypothetical protein [Sphingobium sp.]
MTHPLKFQRDDDPPVRDRAPDERRRCETCRHWWVWRDGKDATQELDVGYCALHAHRRMHIIQAEGRDAAPPAKAARNTASFEVCDGWEEVR